MIVKYQNLCLNLRPTIIAHFLISFPKDAKTDASALFLMLSVPHYLLNST